MVAVAIGGAAVLGAGASIISGNKAASAQEKGAQQAVNEQQSEYNQTRADLAPWRSAGSTALTSLMSAYGLGGGAGGGGSVAPGATGTNGGYGGFFQSPGYQWQFDQGLKAIDHGAASRGMLGSGATVKAEQRYGTGLASQDFGNYTAGLAGIAGVGQSATNTTAQAGSTAASNISNELIASGNARASSYANAGSSVNSGLNNVMSAYLMQNMGAFNPSSGPTTFSDRRLKTNIELVHRDPDGLGWYDWNWKSDPQGEKAHGVIADEVKELRPWAFVPNFRDGYDGVDYAALRSAA